MNIKKFLNDYRVYHVILLGIIFGTIFANNWGYDYITQWGFYNREFLCSISGTDIISIVYWHYIFKKRLIHTGIMILAIFTPVAKIIYLIMLGYLGTCVGILLSSAIINCGMYGILIFLASLLPHYILYLVAIYFMTELVYGEKIASNKVFFILIIIIFIILIGTILEAFVNPYVLKMLL